MLDHAGTGLGPELKFAEALALFGHLPVRSSNDTSSIKVNAASHLGAELARRSYCRGREKEGACHLAVDVGGTFTDICLFDDQEGATRVKKKKAKVSSTRNPIDAVFEGIGEMDVALGEISLFSHGTTVATNALDHAQLPRAAMVTTRGFRDVIEIRRHGVILDWGTGELLPKTTEGFRAMLERRVVPHWKNGPRESRGE